MTETQKPEAWRLFCLNDAVIVCSNSYSDQNAALERAKDITSRSPIVIAESELEGEFKVNMHPLFRHMVLAAWRKKRNEERVQAREEFLSKPLSVGMETVFEALPPGATFLFLEGVCKTAQGDWAMGEGPASVPFVRLPVDMEEDGEYRNSLSLDGANTPAYINETLSKVEYRGMLTDRLDEERYFFQGQDLQAVLRGQLDLRTKGSRRRTWRKQVSFSGVQLAQMLAYHSILEPLRRELIAQRGEGESDGAVSQLRLQQALSRAFLEAQTYEEKAAEVSQSDILLPHFPSDRDKVAAGKLLAHMAEMFPLLEKLLSPLRGQRETVRSETPSSPPRTFGEMGAMFHRKAEEQLREAGVDLEEVKAKLRDGTLDLSLKMPEGTPGSLTPQELRAASKITHFTDGPFGPFGPGGLPEKEAEGGTHPGGMIGAILADNHARVQAAKQGAKEQFEGWKAGQQEVAEGLTAPAVTPEMLASGTHLTPDHTSLTQEKPSSEK